MRPTFSLELCQFIMVGPNVRLTIFKQSTTEFPSRKGNLTPNLLVLVSNCKNWYFNFCLDARKETDHSCYAKSKFDKIGCGNLSI